MPKNFTQAIKCFNPTQTILVLLQTTQANLSFTATASLLNAHDLLTPTGKTWEESHVKALFSRLRNHANAPSALYTTLVRLINAGIVTAAEAANLLVPRKRGRKAVT